MPSKKGLMPDTTPEPPVKNQRTSSPSSDQGDDSEHSDVSKNKKKKKEKKERKSAATAASDSEANETEEQQEKCQWSKKWKHELQALVRYQESHNIFLHNLPPQGGSSHIGYLESRITEADSGFFINPFPAIVKYICIQFFILRANSKYASLSLTASQLSAPMSCSACTISNCKCL